MQVRLEINVVTVKSTRNKGLLGRSADDGRLLYGACCPPKYGAEPANILVLLVLKYGCFVCLPCLPGPRSPAYPIEAFPAKIRPTSLSASVYVFRVVAVDRLIVSGGNRKHYRPLSIGGGPRSPSSLGVCCCAKPGQSKFGDEAGRGNAAAD